MLTVIDKDPSCVIPNVKEGDFLIIRLAYIYADGRSQTDICFTNYYYYNSNHNGTVEVCGCHPSLNDNRFRTFGWERLSLIQLLKDTYSHWKHFVENDIVEYYVIRNDCDLLEVFDRLDLSEEVRQHLSDAFQKHNCQVAL